MNWARAGGLIQRPLVREVILLACAGLFMATVGAFNTRDPGVVRPAVYWMGAMIAGGLVGVGLEIPLAARIRGRLRRAVVLTLVMSAPVMVIVWLASGAVWGSPLSLGRLLGLWPSVLLVCAALNAIRYGVRREPPEPMVGQTEPPPGSLFRQRLSARGRAAPIYAVEAQDHYLRVHTGAGTELVLMRFGDALVELDGLGFQIHRSWWVSKEAIEDVQWRRGRGDLRFKGGATAPVSRSFAPRLREHGWF